MIEDGLPSSNTSCPHMCPSVTKLLTSRTPHITLHWSFERYQRISWPHITQLFSSYEVILRADETRAVNERLNDRWKPLSRFPHMMTLQDVVVDVKSYRNQITASITMNEFELDSILSVSGLISTYKWTLQGGRKEGWKLKRRYDT